MHKHVVAGHYGAADSYQPDIDVTEILARIDLGGAPARLAFGVGEALARLREAGLFPTETGVDLLTLAIHVHAADTRISRSAWAQDGWTREIRLCVPVADPALWTQSTGLLQSMLGFLTGDRWQVGFRQRPSQFQSLVPRRRPGQEGTPYDGVSLFSGGLDSLIGALDELREGRAPFFVSYAGEGAVSRPQADLFEGLRSLVHDRSSNAAMDRLRLAVRFPVRLIPGAGTENTTRGRSFLFLSLGAMAGTGLGKSFELRIPENGFIALNVPLDPTRPGSATTRTTHPYYLRRWNDLLRVLGVDGNVHNPYWCRTKGEMVTGCLSPDLLRGLAARSVSCAHPSTKRFSASSQAHCGTCVPCLIRRAAINAAWGKGGDPTGYRCADLGAQELDPTKAAGQQVRGFQYALDRVRQRPNLASILIHKPGPLGEDLADLNRWERVYSIGLQEVARLLDGVSTSSLKSTAGA